jgi:hypothetical protein
MSLYIYLSMVKPNTETDTVVSCKIKARLCGVVQGMVEALMNVMCTVVSAVGGLVLILRWVSYIFFYYD